MSVCPTTRREREVQFTTVKLHFLSVISRKTNIVLLYCNISLDDRLSESRMQLISYDHTVSI